MHARGTGYGEMHLAGSLEWINLVPISSTLTISDCTDRVSIPSLNIICSSEQVLVSRRITSFNHIYFGRLLDRFLFLCFEVLF